MNVVQPFRPARHLSIGPAPTSLRRTRKPHLWLVLAILAALAVAVAAAVLIKRQQAERETERLEEAIREAATRGPSLALDLPDPNLLRPLSPEEAIQQNQERPFTDRSDTAAAPFRLSTDAISRFRAIDCLTQAVYYEAASEGVEGGRAVAQVVLNRVRHPAYPNSVCGVVYQGSQRTTGCQFTFTCDGSLARAPSAYLWARSRQIAAEALAGRVFAPVGHATHYHADYVLPYWADSLDKATQIGRHIFYRLKGNLGSSRAFAQRYAGKEAPPPAPVAAELVDHALEPAMGNSILPEPLVEEDRVEAIVAGPKAASSPETTLSADLSRGSLILDGDSAPPVNEESEVKPRKKAEQACADGSSSGRIEAKSANDLRVGRTGNGC